MHLPNISVGMQSLSFVRRILHNHFCPEKTQCSATKEDGHKMNVIKTLEERISEALSLHPTSSDNVVRDPPTDSQVGTQAL